MQDKGVVGRGVGVLVRGVKDEPGPFAIGVGGAVLHSTITIASSFVIGAIVADIAIPAIREREATAGALALAVAALLAVSAFKVAGIIARRLGAGAMQYRLQMRYRRQVTRRYLRLPLSWHQKHPTGTLLSNANADVEAVWYPIAPFPFAVGTLVMLVVAAVALFVTDWVMAIVGLAVFPLVFLLNVVYSRTMSPRMTRVQELRADVSATAHESFDGALVVKTMGRETEETERFAAKAHHLRDVNIKVGRIRAAFDPTLAALPNVGVLIVLAVGVSRVLSGATDAGDVVTVAYLLTIVSFPIRSIGWLLGEFPRSVVGYRRVRSVLNATGEMRFGDVRAPEADGGVALGVDNVTYRYVDDQPLLEHLTFHVDPDRTVALVGATASGKSTLTTLLTRLVDPQDGRVTVDGVDLRDLARGELAELVSIVPQTAFLFDDTVRGNITLGADVSDAEVWEALRAAQGDGFVAALPDGLDTRLGERGTSLSGGQRQRISLARALVRRPRLLILDDATSAVDPEVEARILAALRETRTGCTLVVVAYRKATIGLADEVLYLADGAIVDRGPHEVLVARNENYARLVNAYEVEHEAVTS